VNTKGRHTIEPHTLQVVGTDVIFIRWMGDITPEHAHAVNAVLGAMPIPGRSVFMVQDVLKLGAIPPDTRRILAADKNISRIRQMVIINADFKMRVLYTMLHKALLALRAIDCDMEFVVSQPQAMRFVEHVREAKPMR
jgi:hypothetical protein